MYSKILAAVDGSETSMKAFKHAVNLAKIHKAEVTMLTVFEELNLPFGAQYELWAEDSRENYISRVLEAMNKAFQKIRNESIAIEVETRIEEGRPGKKITEIAEKEGFDLIVIGSRGLGNVREMILGSVSGEVVRISNIPVLIIKG